MILSRFFEKIGILNILEILPILKTKIPYFIFFSVLVSILDLIGIAFIGLFILTILKSDFSNFYIIGDYLNNLEYSKAILHVCIILLFIYFIKGIASYSIHKKIIFFCYDQQNILRKKYLELFFFDFDTMRGDAFEKKMGAIMEFIKKITENYLINLLKAISDSIILFAIFIFLIIKDPISTLFLIAVFVISLFFYKLFYKSKIDRLGQKARTQIQILINKTSFIFEAFKEIKLFSKEKDFTNDLISTSVKNTTAVQKFAALLVLPKYYAEFIFVVFVSLFAAHSILRYGNTEIAYAQIGIYAAAATRVAPLMNNFLQSISVIWNNKAAVSEITNFFFEKNMKKKIYTTIQKEDTSEIILQDLVVKNLSFSYDQKIIFKKMDLLFSINSLVGICGNSGSGKTTFVNLLTGFLKPNEGEIFLNNNLGKKVNNKIFKLMGIIPQEIRLMNDTIAKNVSLETDEKKINYEKLKESLIKADCLSFVNELSDNYNTKLEHLGQNLSGGQRQRLAIARVLYRNSKILILDEPFSSLDENSEKKLLKLLNQLKKDRIIFVVTHKASILDYFDIILRKENEKFSVSKN